MTEPAQTPVSDLGYEQARAGLVEVVRRLESGGENLEDALQLWERGEALAERCEQWLAGVRARIEPDAERQPRAADPADTAAADAEPGSAG